ncbi:nucleoside/nucleotide kinase family protein [Limimaricola sp. G21655-S1]|uniref:nucleoside/nucleotide kinase family protein n=1 Tax=unclassified Limimaricola TaxID=2626459 RepID=UPI0022AFDE9A|nr:nucleoside/nucleotide kinase family protein [Limimaricola sp. G21655-S1]MCZ4261990.1 nucleoside/nucleotide kinase family protein [Limimaricola sp. G21655-S1]
MLDLTAYINPLAEMVHEAAAKKPRVIVGVAGAPGSGKSTLATELARRLERQKLKARIVPMDGFHLDNVVLDQRGLRTRKGAPETFDARGFVLLVKRLARGEEVVAPVFDRARDIAIAGAQLVEADAQVVIVEGNYLLFDEAPWSELARIWDVSAYLDVPLPELRARLIARWLGHGLSRTAATQRAMHNDVPNAQRVIDRVLPADLVLRPAYESGPAQQRSGI